MKNLFKCLMAVAIVMLWNAGETFAQVKVPAPSPTATLTQSVGLGEITLEYSRPSVKERAIFGELVPYGQVWRTGANACTKISFSDDVTVEGNAVPAGKYALFTIPGESEWTIILNKNTKQWGASQYSEDDDVARFTVKSEALPFSVESFTIGAGNLKDTGAEIHLIWDKTWVAFNVSVEIDEQVMASIEQNTTLNPNNFYQAASYYQSTGKDLSQAMTYVDKALELYKAQDRKAFWVVRRKALIQADMKDYKSAIATAKKSIEWAKEAKNEDYVRNNEKSIAEWSKLL